jgi:dolichol-phosphate mannosyltransferase
MIATQEIAGKAPVVTANAISHIKLSLVVTVFSETFSIRETIDILFAADRGYIHEIILLTSPRASAETFAICREQERRDPRIRTVVQQNNPGIGWAYREGMQAATGNYVALMAADLETEPAAIDRMITKIIETGCDGVIANRWLKGGGFTNYDAFKLVLNWIFQHMFRVMYWTKLGDLTFGFKILNRKIVDDVKWEGTLHETCIETTVKPLKMGFYIEQIPSVWIGRREGTSVNTFFRNFRYVRLAFKVLFIHS